MILRGEGYSSKSSHIQTSDTQMLFKISNAKSEQSSGSMADNSITFARTHIPDLEIKFDKERARKGSARIKWWPCVTSAVIMLVMMSVLVSVLIYMNAFKIRSRKLTAGQLCHDKQQTGSCLSKGYCCGGQYVIGKDVCAGNGLCCLGPVTKCKDTDHNNRHDFWSFSSLVEISSKVIYRNVSQPVVEQAIVFSLSAIEERDFYDQMSEKISRDMSVTTGTEWLAVVGNRDTFDMSLAQFSAYIIITINEMEIIVLRMPRMAVSVTSEAEAMAYPNYGSDAFNAFNTGIQAEHRSGELLDHRDYGIDTRPALEIIRNELNESMKEIAIQTIDFVLSACLNNYGCVSNRIVETLNQLLPTSGTQWHSIVGTDSVGHQLVVDIEYLRGSLLDVIFNNRHRILIYKTSVHTRVIELDVIESGRQALVSNKTVVYETNPLSGKEMRRDFERMALLKAVRRVVMAADKYSTICRMLTTDGTDYRANYGCVVGPYRGFEYSVTAKMSKSFMAVKLNQLFIILFRDRFNKSFN